MRRSGARDGLVAVYVQGATAAIMIQENWDDSVQTDVVTLLRQVIPKGVWLHDRQDGNGDAHLKRTIMGREVVVAITVSVEGELCARGEVVAVRLPETMRKRNT